MKNLLLCSVLLCLLISCSNDSDLDSSDLNNSTVLNSIKASLPANKANPLDYQGKQYYDALTNYQKQNQFPNSVKEITDQIRFITPVIGKRQSTGKNIIAFNDSIVESIMADPDNSIIVIVQNSLLSGNAKSSLISFLQGLITQRTLEFSITYDYIVDYEETIIESSTWSEDDKDTILTVTSISRYSLYSESQRKDRDWEKTAGNKSAKTVFSTNETSIISIIALLDKII